MITAIAGVNITIESTDGTTKNTYVVDPLTTIRVDAILGTLADIQVGDMVSYRLRVLPGLTNHIAALGVLQ